MRDGTHGNPQASGALQLRRGNRDSVNPGGGCKKVLLLGHASRCVDWGLSVAVDGPLVCSSTVPLGLEIHLAPAGNAPAGASVKRRLILMSVEPWCVKALRGVNRGSAYDIGANAGAWSLMLCQTFAEVYAVEPDPRAFAELKAALAAKANCTLFNAAVSSFTGSGTLFLRPSSLQSSLLEVSPIGGNGGEPCPAIESADVLRIRLDDISGSAPDFIKVDIEGSEVEAMLELDRLRWQRTTFLVECHDTAFEISSRLLELGKSVERIPHPHSGDAHPGHCWVIGRPA